MREELQSVFDAISRAELPSSWVDLFHEIWDGSEARFTTQETYIIDFKETIPEKFSTSYGAGIIRLVLAFHNTFGGVIVFGVRDKIFDVVGTDVALDIEALNRALSDFSGLRIETICKLYKLEIKGRIFHVYPVHAKIRKSLCDMMRKLSVIWFRSLGHFRGSVLSKNAVTAARNAPASG